MRITTSSVIVLFFLFFISLRVHSQETKSLFPDPFKELMQMLSASGTLEGLVYADFNANGIQDVEEPGLEDVRVIVVNSNGNGQTSLTNSDGLWSKQVIEGSANVIIDLTSLPAGFLQTEGTDPSTSTVIASDTVQAQTKGYTFQGDATGHLYFDENGNGVQDTLELDMPDVDVLITNQYGDTQTVTTDVDGNWIATVLFGDIEVEVVTSDPDFPTGAFQTEGTNPSSHLIPQGQETFTENDGFFESGILSGTLYFDDDGSGNQDAGEQGISNVTVEVTTSLGEIITLTTDGAGFWSTRVPEGTTVSQIDENDPEFPLGASQTDGDNPTTTEVVKGETYQEFDGFLGSGILRGHLYFDENGNGTQDVGEPDMPDVTVEIINSFGSVNLIETDVNGDWEIEVPAGNTFSNIDNLDSDFPTGATQTEGTDPTLTQLTAGDNVLSDIDGFFELDPELEGTLTGHLYSDSNGNGTQETGEPDLPNIDVQITDSFGDVTMLTTDANGDWSILVPSGNTISDIQQNDPDFPTGAVQTEGTDPTTTFVVAETTILSDNDGFFELDPELEGTLTGHLYFDTNGNGTQDVGEPDMPNVDVEIIDSFGFVTILETDVNGDWSIEVPAGNTFSNIDENDPDFPQGANQTEGTDPSLTFVIADETTLSDIDGFFITDPNLLGTLLGHLYFDVNGNGTQDVAEPDMPNVDVEIIDSFGVVSVIETDVNGDWSIEVPAGNTFSNIDENDPDFPLGATQTEGTDPSLTFVPAETTTLSDNDGFFISDPDLTGTLTGHLYLDTNANANQDSGEPDLEGIEIIITDVFGDETVITTDASGNWSVEVPAGSTISNINQLSPNFPSGATQTEGTDPTSTFVTVGNTTFSEDDGFFVPNPDLRGTLLGHLYFDDNGNGTQDVGEPDMPNVDIEIIDVFNNVILLETDVNGDWSIEVPAGNTFSNIDEQDPDFPSGAIQTEGTDPSLTVVVANATTLSDNDGYFIQDPSLTGTLSGHLYFDNNNNGTQDATDPDMPNVTVQIEDGDGIIQNVVTNADGDWSTTVAAGEAISLIDIADPNFPQGADQTEGDNPTTTLINIGDDLQETPDGFFTENQTGILTGRLYFDNNGNGTQDSDEDGIANVGITITDATGAEFETETNSDGDWSIEILAGETQSKINTDDPDFPVNATQTEGTDPTTTTVVAGETVTSDNDGFLIDDIVIFNAVGSEGNQLNSFFRISGIENYPENSVQIFNRQGVEVFNAEGYNNSDIRFDGFSEGNITIQKDKRLPPGTYFYILEYINRAGELQMKKGFLHLN